MKRKPVRVRRSPHHPAMLESMTGFAEVSARHDNVFITVSLKSVNSKNLRISTSGNKQCLEIEKRAYQMIREQFARGSISLTTHISHDPLSPSSLKALSSIFSNIPEDFTPLTFEGGSLLRALQHTDIPGGLSDDVIESVTGLIRKSVKELKASRKEEGNKLAGELIPRAGIVKDFAEELTRRQPEIDDLLQKELERSVNELLKITGSSVDRSDLARECAIRLEKADIREETDRLLFHIETLIDTVTSEDDVVGKKLDFICQELHREVNTLGVKAKDTSIVSKTVTVKTEIEKLREQIQNVQ